MNLFKKMIGFEPTTDPRPFEPPVIGVMTRPPFAPPHGPTVEDVHREFFTASDRIMEEVSSILAKNTISKSDRLVGFGFMSATDVMSSKDLVRKNLVAAVIEKYQLTHPTTKVITAESVDTICAKYKLLHAEVSRFKGFVPEKNLREMEAFSYPGQFDVMESNYMGMRSGGSSRLISTHNTREEADMAADAHNRGWAWVRTPKEKLTICAPERDMIIYNHERVVNGQITVPDPVVLCRVENSCFLIVTAWGDEASDPLVFNEKNN